MTFYQARPHVVPAFQMTEERQKSNADWPQWLHEAWKKPPFEKGALYGSRWNSTRMEVNTKTGAIQVGWGDWIVRWETGALDVFETDDFETIFEPIEE